MRILYILIQIFYWKIRKDYCKSIINRFVTLENYITTIKKFIL